MSAKNKILSYLLKMPVFHCAGESACAEYDFGVGKIRVSMHFAMAGRM
jgi:hypothetical protein